MNGDEVVIADGIIEEFEIAKELGLVIVPIGCSGYAAEHIWNQTMDKFEEIFPEDDGKIKKCMKNWEKLQTIQWN